jgi:hypothetical protein
MKSMPSRNYLTTLKIKLQDQLQILTKMSTQISYKIDLNNIDKF